MTPAPTSGSLPPMFKSVYAFLGNDEIRMRAKVRSLVEKAVDEEFRAFNFNQFSPGDASPLQIEETILQYPLGGGHRVVLVRDLNSFSASEQEAIADLAHRMAQETDGATTLALLAPGLDRRKRPYRMLADLDSQPSGQVVQFEAPKPWEIDKWVADRAAERGIRLESGTAQALVDLVGDNLMVLDGELTKLELYLGAGAPVDVETVERVVGRRRGESPWDLPRTLIGGKEAEAQRLATRLLESGEGPVFLLSVLTRYVLEIYQIRLLLDEGASRGNIVKEVGIKSFAADSAIETARRISPDAFPGMLEALKECDIALKSRTKQDEVLIQQVVGRLAREAAPASGSS